MASLRAKAFLFAAALAAATVVTGPVDAGPKRGRGAPDFSRVDLRSPALKMAEAWRKRAKHGAARPAFAGRFISPTVSVNSRAADTTANDGQVSPSIVDMGSGRLVAAYFDGGSDPGNGPRQLTGVSTTANSGALWVDRGALPVSALGDNANPALAADTFANIVYLAVSDGILGETVQVFKSTDFGQSFGAPVNGLPGFAGTGEQLDSVHIAVDNENGAGNGNVYVCATDFFASGNEIRFSRSTDKGATFLPDHSDLPPPLASAATGCKIVVSPNQQVNVFYFRGRGTAAGGDNKLFVRRSTDFGVTFGPEIEIADLATRTPLGNLKLRNRLTTTSFAVPVANRNSSRRFLYAVFNDDPDLANPNDNGAIFMVQSQDDGATWSAPILIDNAKGDQFAPAIGIQPVTGRLMVSWSTTSDDPTGRMFHRQARLGLINANGSVTFFNDFRLGPNTPPTFFGLEGLSGASVGSFGNTQAIWADSRFGNAFHVRQTDIYHARIANPPLAGDLSVTGGFTPASVALGATTQLDLTVAAAGAAQADVLASVTFDKATVKVLTATPSAGRCDTIEGFVTCNFGTIPAGASRTIALTVQPLIQTGPRIANVNVTTSNIDANLANNTLARTLTINTGTAVSTTVATGSIAVAIPEAGTVEIPVNFPSTGTVVNIRPHFRLDHGFDADLVISLVAPTGETTVLANQVGLGEQNFGSGPNDCTGTRTLFDELATTPIADGTAPFAGTFKPEETLLNVMGIPSQGTWKLRIDDILAGIGGTVGCFKITLVRKP